MKTLFTISMLLFSVSAFALINANDINHAPNANDINPVTGTTGSSTSTVGTSTGTTTPTTDATMVPTIDVGPDGNYKASLKERKLAIKAEKAITKAEIKDDAAVLGKEIEAIIKNCKTKMFGAAIKDYQTKSMCFENKINTMNNERHRVILSAIIIECNTSYDYAITDTDRDMYLYMMQRKYLCYRNALRAALKTRKGLVIGWGDKESNMPYVVKSVESSTIESENNPNPDGTTTTTTTTTESESTPK